MQDIYDVVIVGAGQAGIAMSYHLKLKGIENHLMVDANNRIGNSWRSRYKSLVLFTPKSYSSLPGLDMVGDPNSYPTKNEMADYLEEYVAHFRLPCKMNTTVTKVEKKNQYFHIHTINGKLLAKKVVIASGAIQRKYIPPIISNESAISHIHSSSYMEPKNLQNGVTLVVGGGNSGAQIAIELSKDREVHLAISHQLTFIPLQILGKSIFSWLEKLQLLYAGTDTMRGKMIQKRKDPVFGKELKIAIKNQQIKVKPRVTEVDGEKVIFSDGRSLTVTQIIWSTGFIPAYEIIEIDGAVDEKGKPIHSRGVSPIDGLYYIGLPWQYSRGSALVCGVGKDAEYLVEKIDS